MSLLLPNGKVKNILGRWVEIWCLSHNWIVTAVNATLLGFFSLAIFIYNFFIIKNCSPFCFICGRFILSVLYEKHFQMGEKNKMENDRIFVLKITVILSNLSWEWTSSLHPTFKCIYFSEQKVSHALKYAKYIYFPFRI